MRPGAFNPGEAKALPAAVEPFTPAQIRAGDVLTVRGSGSRKLIGSVCKVAEEPNRLLLSDLVLRIRFDESRVDTDYIVHALSSPAARWQIENEVRGTTTLGKISREIIRGLEIPLPTIEVQRQIARRLALAAEEVTTAADQVRLCQNLRVALVTFLLDAQSSDSLVLR